MRRRTHLLPAAAVAAAIVTCAVDASAYHEGDDRIVDETAHTLRPRETRIGLWSIDFAPFGWCMIGTDTLPWAASFFADSLVANGHLKLRVLHTRPLTIALAGAAYHAGIETQDGGDAGHGSLWVVPLTLLFSSDITHALSVHFGTSFAYADLDGELARTYYRTVARFRATALELHGMVELRLTRVVALTAEAHAQPYTSVVAVDARSASPALNNTTVDFAGSVSDLGRSAYLASGAVVLSGKHVNTRLGAGYGAVFLPGVGFALPITTVVPEVDFSVRF
jgi:hypothetical protein